MQAANEIRSYVRNIRYYADKITALARKQIDIDSETGSKRGINIDTAEIRFNCLGDIEKSCDWIKAYCENIETNVKNAETRDIELYTDPIEENKLKQES